MTRVEQLFNHHRQPVGTATWNRKNSTVSIAYSNEIHYADTTLDFNDFDAYIARMDLTKESELNQLSMEDLM